MKAFALFSLYGGVYHYKQKRAQSALISVKCTEMCNFPRFHPFIKEHKSILLNQWSRDDRILMEDSNADNQKIEAALGALAAVPSLLPGRDRQSRPAVCGDRRRRLQGL